jgi:hypothetical protein
MIVLTDKDSNNVKLGRNVRTTYRVVGAAANGGTCPSTCAMLQNKACYAMYGHVNFAAKRGVRADDDATRLRAWLTLMPRDKRVRHHVSGDFMKNVAEEDGAPAREVVDTEYVTAMLEGHAARPDVVGWTYTHAHAQLDPALLNSVPTLTVNASCDSHEELQRALKAGWPAVLSVAEDAEDHVLDLGGERVRIRICPAQTNEGMVCSACMLCAKTDRSQVIGFRMHGSGRKRLHGSTNGPQG